MGSAQSGAVVVEWIARETVSAFPPIDPALQLLLSTSGTTGSQKYVRLSRDAVVANARQIAQALAIDEQSVGIAHLPLCTIPTDFPSLLRILTSVRPKNEFRLIRLDQARKHIFGNQGINQRGRMPCRRCRKKADDRFGIDAAKQKNESLMFRGDGVGEIKARVAQLLAVIQLSLRSS